MLPPDVIAGVIAVVLIGLGELAIGLHGIKRKKGDWIIEILALVQYLLLTRPAIILFVHYMLSTFAPDLKGAGIGTPLWLAFLIVFLPEDFTHYWMHRFGHTNRSLWKLHRTHHSSNKFQVSVTFRENAWWYAMFPGNWWGAFMLYLGFTEAFIISTTLVGTHNIIIHMGVEWDRKLYTLPVIGKVYRFFELIFQSPAAHRAHHGLGSNSKQMGNYGLCLFIWDILFKTAYLPGDRIPKKYGVARDYDESWQSQLWWPLVSSPEPKSDLYKIDLFGKEKSSKLTKTV